MAFDKALKRLTVLSLTACLCAAFLSSCGNSDSSDSEELATTDLPSLTVTTAADKADHGDAVTSDTTTTAKSETSSQKTSSTAQTSKKPSGTTLGTSKTTTTTKKTTPVTSKTVTTTETEHTTPSQSSVTTTSSSLTQAQPQLPAAIDGKEYLINLLKDVKLKNAARSVMVDMEAGKKEITIADGILKESEISQFIGFISMLEAESYIIPSSYIYTVNKSGYVVALKISDYPKTLSQFQSEKDAVEKIAEEIVLQAEKTCATQFDKVLYFHDYIINHCTYDLDAANGASAYGCLIEGRAVCEGYAKAMLVLCNKAGIESILITGSAAYAGNTQSHMWNLVKLDGTWAHVDATWDDIESGAVDACNYSYFGLTDKEIHIDHTVSNLSIMTVPKAESNEASYYIRKGYYINSDQRIGEIFKNAVFDAVKHSAKTVTVRCADDKLYADASALAKSGKYEYEFLMELIKEAKNEFGSKVSISGGFLLGDCPNAKGTHTIIIFLKYDA